MKLLRMAAAGAAAALALVGTAAHAQTQAQTTAEMSQPIADQNTLTAVGGSPAGQTAMGAPMGKTRDQVYREMVESQRNGDAQRIQDLYKQP
ncbi:hypothetical protein VSR82_35590 [Burkholderia sp. JPY481]|uniref:hypothetical protein n=1 Tax=Paraburkholderia sp. JPY465 TaxID=3042285 RepID=UPI0031790B1B